MKNIVSISLGGSAGDYDFTTRFMGQSFRLRRFGVDHDLGKALDMLAFWQGECDALGLGLVADHLLVGTRRLEDPTTAKLEAAVSEVPVTTGARLRSILDEWAIRHIQAHEQRCFTNARVLFLSGLANYAIARAVSEYTRNLSFADPLLQLGLPTTLGSVAQLEAYAALTAPVQRQLQAVWRKVPSALRDVWTRQMLGRAAGKADILVGPHDGLTAVGREALDRKIVLSSAISDAEVKRLGDQGVDVVIDRTPKLLERVVGLNIIEAMIIAALGRQHRDDVLYDEYLEIFGEMKLAPRILFPSGKPRRRNRFAFVIHPLSREYLKASKPVELASRIAPSIVLPVVEKIIAYSPPFVYSRVTGIKSPTGTEAEGWLITVGGTPKELLAHSPEFTYRRLLAAAKIAERLGAQIMGLGAFTKVVGDAGVTVAKRASIPITTGNSYSASAALWAAADAVKRLGLLSRGEGRKVAGKAMVVGATGAIGSVCARLLAMSFEEVCLISPEIGKLLTLRETILADTPDAVVHLSSKADENLRDMDLVVTATSGAGRKILDIMKVKPGCVITDVARPLDLPPSEVAKRPDVLVIESGEIQVPGGVRMRDIGLPEGVVYACLAETIVLALEGRFESYTVGRNIEWEKVKEIYKLGLKHGMRLAAISGVNGPYSDEDIRRVREFALAARERRPREEKGQAAAPERGQLAAEPVERAGA
ncbi:MAG TPA: dehydrogenase [Anaeromyxobacteraceae bacterium]|nr:dehydrogenase [Anaeromyxobacteraceae bacterium]